MGIYIEDCLMANFIKCICLISSCDLIFKLKTNKKLIIFVSLIYSVFNLIIIYIDLLVSFKLLISFVIVVVCIKIYYNKSKKIVYYSSIFIVINCVINAVVNLLTIQNSLYFNYSQSLIFITIMFASIFIKNLIKDMSKYIFKKKQIENYVFELEIFLNKKSVKTRGFLDSGNSAYSKQLDLPIIFINNNLFAKLLSQNDLKNYLFGQYDNLHNISFIQENIATFGGNKCIKLFVPDKVVIDGKQIDEKLCIGITNANIVKTTNCEVLLHSKLIVR